MSTARPGPQGPPATLTTLPQDVLLHILDQMTPAQLSTYAQLCRATALSAADPALWASLARRHLGVAPALPTLSPAAVSALASSLLCRWWLSAGAFVPGVTVHFRKRFLHILPRGGVERPVSPDASAACYVFGGPHAEHAVPVPVPGVTLSFALDAEGPFPMDGMLLRLVHAAEPAEPADHPADRPADHPADHPDPAPMAPLSLPQGPCAPPPAHQEARIRVRLNSATIADLPVPTGPPFAVLRLPIAPEHLLTKPRINNLAVEFDRASNLAYWLREVCLAPAILPMPPVPPAHLVFAAPPAPREAPGTVELVPEPVPEPVTEPAPGEGEPAAPRRAVRQVAPHAVRFFGGDVQPGGKFHKGGKKGKLGKKPKHVFHHSHYRSPRGPAPASPGRSRSGR